MEELDLSLAILSDIIDNDVPFNEALRKVFQADVNKRPLRSSVAGLVGCELRHHLLFVYLTTPLENYSEEEKRILSLGLGDLYFVKRLPEADIKDALKTRLGEEKYALAEPLIAKENDPASFIPEELAKSSNKYLSLRYNTPEWVLKIWEHFGYGTTYKVLKKNNHPLVTSVRVRSVISAEELLNNNPDYVKSSVEGMLLYGGKVPLRKLNEWRDGKIFAEKLATKALFDAHKVEEPCEVFLYDGNADSSPLKEIVESYGSTIGINLGVKDLQKYADVTRLIQSMGLKNVNFFAADPSSMEASISRPQDLVIAAPDSSNFDLIREYPDYLLHFKKEGMDALFAQEKATLEGCSKFVAENGTYIYMIYTISRKEGHSTIADFLLNHREFQLVEEKQEFPFEDHDTSLYYAVMKKVTPLAKDTVPLTELGSNLPKAAALSSASEAKPAEEKPVEEAKPAEAKPVEEVAPAPKAKATKKAEPVVESKPIEEAKSPEETKPLEEPKPVKKAKKPEVIPPEALAPKKAKSESKAE